jgi:hypothetical protein
LDRTAESNQASIWTVFADEAAIETAKQLVGEYEVELA